jgi:hypothetical protein
MTLPAQNDSMFPLTYLLSQTQMRRSLVGALATDPVVPERRPRTRRPARPHAAPGTRAVGPARSSAGTATGPSGPAKPAREGARTA